MNDNLGIIESKIRRIKESKQVVNINRLRSYLKRKYKLTVTRYLVLKRCNYIGVDSE